MLDTGKGEHHDEESLRRGDLFLTNPSALLYFALVMAGECCEHQATVYNRLRSCLQRLNRGLEAVKMVRVRVTVSGVKVLSSLSKQFSDHLEPTESHSFSTQYE